MRALPFLYAVFMRIGPIPHRFFMPRGLAEKLRKRSHFMGDIITILFSTVIFTLLFAYIPACEHV
ncbi:MAG: hypothetical protein KGH75_13165 [Rhodospirillales bacterium]|nr:hypothetical protein [Rhodospirillales bacterium]